MIIGSRFLKDPPDLRLPTPLVSAFGFRRDASLAHLIDAADCGRRDRFCGENLLEPVRDEEKG